MSDSTDPVVSHLEAISRRLETMDRRFDAIDNKFNKIEDKIDSKLDRVETRLDTIDKTTVKQQTILDEHMRRTALLEAKVAPLEKAAPTQKWMVRVALVLGTFALAGTKGLEWVKVLISILG